MREKWLKVVPFGKVGLKCKVGGRFVFYFICLDVLDFIIIFFLIKKLSSRKTQRANSSYGELE